VVARLINAFVPVVYLKPDYRGWECHTTKHVKYPIEFRHHKNVRDRQEIKQYIVKTTGEIFDNLAAAIDAVQEKSA